MTGVEVDFVVSDSIKALELYESIFEVQRAEVTDNEKGLNEAVFTMYGARFHMLDENPEYQMTAPKEGDPKPMWLNVLVEDISALVQADLQGFHGRVNVCNLLFWRYSSFMEDSRGTRYTFTTLAA